MKFSHTVQFNSVPEWQQHYIAYSNLKKLIYQIEKELFALSVPSQSARDEESVSLVSATTKANQKFMPALDSELKKIITFYTSKESELLIQVEQLERQVDIIKNSYDKVDSSHLFSSIPEAEEPSEQGTNLESVPNLESDLMSSSLLSSSPNLLERSTLTRSNSSRPVSQYTPIQRPKQLNRPFSFSGNEDRSKDNTFANFSSQGRGLMLTKSVIDVFVQLSELKNYVTLNFTGFTKILKKYDKVANCTVAKPYLTLTVQKSYPYLEQTKDRLESSIAKVHDMYATLRGVDSDAAYSELKTHLREHLVWERNTVWRDMISMERKANAVGLKLASPFASTESLAKVRRPRLVCGLTYPFPEALKTTCLLLACVSAFLILLKWSPFENVEANNCLALLVLASLLWATEVVPLFVTALLVPFLVVVLRVLRDEVDGHRLTAPEATHLIFASMFSPVIMLLLGGFSLASALSKHHLAKKVASAVLALAGTNPTHVLLANMVVATFLSMWISNVAAPVLCFSLIQPLLRTLPQQSPYAKSLIVGIALASNIGGMASPIASPQNVIAIATMDPPPSWLQWFAVSLPVCLFADLVVWVLLLIIYKPQAHNLTINHIRYTPERLTRVQIYVMFVTILTITLWCIAKPLEPYVGDMGILAILPLLLFFGTGVLSKDDFNGFLWTVVILAMGGIALGKGVSSSGLLAIIASDVSRIVGHMGLYGISVTLGIFTLVVTTFISHTVGAVIILPIVAQIGTSLPDPHPRLLVMSSALICSAAMGLPVSGFPNMNAALMEDETGQPYLSVKDFLVAGIPASVLVYGIIATIGFLIMKVLGF